MFWMFFVVSDVFSVSDVVGVFEGSEVSDVFQGLSGFRGWFLLFRFRMKAEGGVKLSRGLPYLLGSHNSECDNNQDSKVNKPFVEVL